MVSCSAINGGEAKELLLGDYLEIDQLVVSNGFHLHHLSFSVVFIFIGIMVVVVAVVLTEAILVAAGVIVIIFLSQCMIFAIFTI